MARAGTARRAVEKAAALRQGLTASNGETRRPPYTWRDGQVDPWRRVGGEQDLQTAAYSGGDGAVGLSFETHHGGGVAPSPEFAASSCSAEIMVLLLLQRGELLVRHDRPSHHHCRRFPTPQPAEAAAAVDVGWGFQVLRLRAFSSF
uniref:Uncharacterized protein n=1 Tax=Oryza meridionalis TaxID=40149 RepID=A0A0E0F785_9ORYZ